MVVIFNGVFIYIWGIWEGGNDILHILVPPSHVY